MDDDTAPPAVKLAAPIERRIREIVAEEIALALTRIKAAQTARPDYDSGGTAGGIR